MSRHPIPLSIMAIALSACVVEPELLNSERISQRFGSYGIDLLDSDDDLRRANLYSIENGVKVCRTYAIVRFDNIPKDLIGQEHAQIVAGSSIGATLKASGWTVFKETRYVGDMELPADDNGVLPLMRLQGPRVVAIHVYRLLLKNDSDTIDYSTIIEIHHPDYLDSSAVRDLYIVDTPLQPIQAEVGEFQRLVLQ